EIVAPVTDSGLYPRLSDKLDRLCCCLKHPYTYVRNMAARCLGTLATVIANDAMCVVVQTVLPMLGASDDNTVREGAIECIAYVIERLDLGIIPFIALMILPVLGRLSDPASTVRLTATHCFATLVRLMPLEGSAMPNPPT